MKAILVHIDSDEGQGARLRAAIDLARAYGGHVCCLQVTPYAAVTMVDPFTGAVAMPELVEALREQSAAQRTAIEPQLRRAGIAWDWTCRDGDSTERLCEAARLADVVVMSCGPFENDIRGEVGRTGDVAIDAPVAVLAVAPHHAGLDVQGKALVAWDGSQGAATALRAALPMLRLAQAVDILTVGDVQTDYPAAAAAAYLLHHGIAAEVILRGDDGGSVESVIRGVLTERRSAWLVQGAYGHSRWREALFGGVTRGMLADAPVPLVMAR